MTIWRSGGARLLPFDVRTTTDSFGEPRQRTASAGARAQNGFAREDMCARATLKCPGASSKDAPVAVGLSRGPGTGRLRGCGEGPPARRPRESRRTSMWQINGCLQAILADVVWVE